MDGKISQKKTFKRLLQFKHFLIHSQINKLNNSIRFSSQAVFHEIKHSKNQKQSFFKVFKMRSQIFKDMNKLSKNMTYSGMFVNFFSLWIFFFLYLFPINFFWEWKIQIIFFIFSFSFKEILFKIIE